MKIAVVLVLGITVSWFFYDFLFNLLYDPYAQAEKTLRANGVDSKGVIGGIGNPLLLRLKICALATVVVASPFWLYQIWAFIVPGLHPREKRWTKLFAVAAGPLFVAGVAMAYYVLPKGIEVLIGFTPGTLQSLVEFGDYFRFLTRMMLVFGVAFEIPLFVILLNLAGVLSGKTLGKYRPWIVVGTFVFAAVATPSTDPFSMLMLAIPMLLLFFVSEAVARLVDRRRARQDFDDLSDDEASTIEEDDAFDHGRSDLREEDD